MNMIERGKVKAWGVRGGKKQGDWNEGVGFRVCPHNITRFTQRNHPINSNESDK